MLVVAIVTLLCLLVAGLVLFYVAYPHRGETPPAQTEWLGDVLTRAVDAMPTLSSEETSAPSSVPSSATRPGRELADR